MPETVRLLFEYRDGKFVPLAAQKVNMVAPHDIVPRDAAPTEGRFVELRSADDETIRSVRVGEAGPPRVEFPTGEEDQPFGRTEAPPGSVVSVVVDADERATHAALVEVSPGKGFGEMNKRDLAVIPLSSLDA